ncbi:hypothetical protein M3Y98_00028700 [Aphelenchoides besseyi]|nr:hypothetical protein M3Y98_00028700 [Aphelenchoides besseyi]KAI6199327.1 hypothetical protein M3Y96_00615100 [Aphelenchoides besseyi]
MSVDKTIEELSGTLAQLGVLVEHINTQIVGITSRINLTLDNFDNSVTGISSDAGFMTNQVAETISQVPSAWIFYLLFITLIVVFVLLSILIIINLATRIHAIYRILRGDTTRNDSPIPSMAYSESKQPLNLSNYPASPKERMRHHVAVPIETEPRRYGMHDPIGGYAQESVAGSTTQHSYYQPSRTADVKQYRPIHRTIKTLPQRSEQVSTSFVHYRPEPSGVIYSTPSENWQKREDESTLPPPMSVPPKRITSVLESNGTDVLLRRPAATKEINSPSQRIGPRYQTAASATYLPHRHSMRAADPV